MRLMCSLTKKNNIYINIKKIYKKYTSKLFITIKKYMLLSHNLYILLTTNNCPDTHQLFINSNINNLYVT